MREEETVLGLEMKKERGKLCRQLGAHRRRGKVQKKLFSRLRGFA